MKHKKRCCAHMDTSAAAPTRHTLKSTTDAFEEVRPFVDSVCVCVCVEIPVVDSVCPIVNSVCPVCVWVGARARASVGASVRAWVVVSV